MLVRPFGQCSYSWEPAHNPPGDVSIWRCRLTCKGIPMLKISRSHYHLLFNMGILIHGKDGLYIEPGPWFQVYHARVKRPHAAWPQHDTCWLYLPHSHQSGRSPKVVALFSATNFSGYIIELLQLRDTIKIKWNYAWIHYNKAIRSHLMI